MYKFIIVELTNAKSRHLNSKKKIFMQLVCKNVQSRVV